MDTLYLAAIFVAFFVVLWFVSVISRWFLVERSQSDVPVRDISKGHHWVIVDAFQPGYYCNQCETSTYHGAQCDFCGIIVDNSCLRKANSQIPCKAITSIESVMRHHWVKGNLSHHSICAVCERLCGDGPGLRDFRCCWCQVALHSRCLAAYTTICDFGTVKRVVVPPNCVRLKKAGWKGRRHLVLDEVLKPDISNWSPVLVVANRKSGNGEGEVVLEAFRRILNPAQVLDLTKVSPEVGLRWCSLLPDVKCRVLVAGGDGTIGWVLSAIESLALDPAPMVCPLPLGTGNDLSRVLGWGSGHDGEVDAEAILESLAAAKPVMLDRWSVTVQNRRHFGLRRPDRKEVMSNYMSIGVDALVTLNFHNTRNTMPRVLSGRVMNKFLFFGYGTVDVVERACSQLHRCVELYMDGKLVDLPELEGIVLLNIPCWGAGVKPWGMGRYSEGVGPPTQAIDDGKIEVFGLYSSFHIAQLQVGLSEPLRFGQAKEVVLRIFRVNRVGPLPMQVDGEPWLQGPATITIRNQNLAAMLANPESPLQSPRTSSTSSANVIFS